MGCLPSEDQCLRRWKKPYLVKYKHSNFIGTEVEVDFWPIDALLR